MQIEDQPDFIQQYQKTFGQQFKESQDPSQLQKLIENSDHKKILYISGFMYDGGSEKCHLRSGEEKGASIFLDQLKIQSLFLENPHKNIQAYLYDSQIQHPVKLRIDESDDLSIGQDKYIKKLDQIVTKESIDKIKLVSVGGSWDQTYCILDVYKRQNPGKVIGMVNISAKLNSKFPVQKEQIDGQSVFRSIQEINDSKTLKILHFSTQNSQSTSQEVQFVKSKNNKIVWLESGIRRNINQKYVLESQNNTKNNNNQKIQQLYNLLNNNQLYTQSGILFAQNLIELYQSIDILIIAFNCDSVNSKFCSGVSEPSVVGGLTQEESFEIMNILGQIEPECIIMAGFNPAVEKHLTSKFLVNLLYEYCSSLNSNINKI